MKKKILALFVLSFLVVNVVSAAGIWGSYKGSDVVRLTVNGDPTKTTDVPAIIYQGRTMVPLYLLPQAGLSYTWDQSNLTVDIIKKKIESALPSDRFSNGVGLTDMNNWAFLASYYSQMDSIAGEFYSMYGMLGVLSTAIVLHANDANVEKSASDLKSSMLDLEKRFNLFIDTNKSKIIELYDFMNAPKDPFNSVNDGYNASLDNLFGAYNSLSNYYKNGVQSDFDDFVKLSGDGNTGTASTQKVAKDQFAFWINGVIQQKP